PPASHRFPYTTLFRSPEHGVQGQPDHRSAAKALRGGHRIVVGALVLLHRQRGHLEWRVPQLHDVAGALCEVAPFPAEHGDDEVRDRKSTRLDSSHEWT